MREPDRLSPSRKIALKAEPIPVSHALYALRPVEAPETPPAPRTHAAAPRRGWRRLAVTGAALAAVWGGLTGWDPTSWVFGVPVVAAATAFAFHFAPAPAWRLSLPGGLRFAVWFAVASVRSGLDVAGRALGWHLALRPGFRSYCTSLPPGPARICLANTISLLPGTLSAEIAGDRIEVHMLDTGVDLTADLADLEARIRALFALPAPGAMTQTHHIAKASNVARTEDMT